MHLDFETLENRRTFLNNPVAAFTLTPPRQTRGVAMPLRHERIIPRRRPLADQEQWITAEFRVDPAPIRLWASAEAVGGTA